MGTGIGNRRVEKKGKQEGQEEGEERICGGEQRRWEGVA